MWALQSQQFTLNWQFDFTHQLNYAAVEANWRLALDPSAADKEDIVLAAAFAPEKCGTPPGDWHIDHYYGADFHTARACEVICAPCARHTIASLAHLVSTRFN